jgi:4-hydroxyphenylpyruvate dioxygenase-like putative hemolysin
MKLICPRCRKVYDSSKEGNCPNCGLHSSHLYDFKNSEDFLKEKVNWAIDERKKYGLDGLAGGLEFIIVNTEPEHQRGAVEELLRYTGFEIRDIFEDGRSRTCVLGTEGSADALVNSRQSGENPFTEANKAPRTGDLPNTRFETFVFNTKDIEKYFEKQRERGVGFLTDEIVHTDTFSFIQTEPSKYTGNSIGLVQWNAGKRNYQPSNIKQLDWSIEKPENAYLGNIKELDHVATRVRAVERDAAIIEFMSLTNYDFDFAVYVDILNSITNVARLKDEKFAMVITSGISPYVSDELSGPTEKFIRRYGTRSHHMAFRTEHIEDTFAAIKDDEMEFLVELVGSSEDGLKQTFTMPSKHTMLVNEYIHRYEGFAGFFTKHNVTELTRATEKQ